MAMMMLRGKLYAKSRKKMDIDVKNFETCSTKHNSSNWQGRRSVILRFTVFSKFFEVVVSTTIIVITVSNN